MEAQYKCRNGRLVIKVDAGDQKTLFKRIAETEAVFDAASACGMCGFTDLAFQVRTVDANDYYALICRKCGAQMSFGQHKTGSTLFPKLSSWKQYTREEQGSFPEGIV